jgi:hypothetical protein
MQEADISYANSSIYRANACTRSGCTQLNHTLTREVPQLKLDSWQSWSRNQGPIHVPGKDQAAIFVDWSDR